MKTTLSILACSLGVTGCLAADPAGDRDGAGKGDLDEGSDMRFEFSFRDGADHGFQAIFRDVYTEVHAEYLRRKTQGIDLGPIAPLEQNLVDIPEDFTHWLMHDGIYELPDNLGGHGLLVQGTNRSDDMDMYIVKELGPADGLAPNTTYRVQFELLELAGDAPLGAFGVGGGPDLGIDGVATTTNPLTFVEEHGHVRHPDGVFAVPRVSLGGNSVCLAEGAIEVPAIPPCPSGRIPFALNTFTQGDEDVVTITTDDNARLWIMIGGHSGYESFSAIYYTRVAFSLDEQRE